MTSDIAVHSAWQLTTVRSIRVESLAESFLPVLQLSFQDMSYEEFKAWLMREGDTVNKDGKIEKAEVREYGNVLPIIPLATRSRSYSLMTLRAMQKLPVIMILKSESQFLRCC